MLAYAGMNPASSMTRPSEFLAVERPPCMWSWNGVWCFRILVVEEAYHVTYYLWEMSFNDDKHI